MIGASFLLGPGLRYAGIGVAALAIGAIGFAWGLDWRAGQVEAARAKTEAALVRADKAEADYAQLRQEVGAAMARARDRAAELETKNAAARDKASKDYRVRVDGVLDAHRRLLDAVAQSGRSGPAGAVSGDQPGCRTHDPAAEREFAGALLAADRDRARLVVLQELIRAHDANVLDPTR